MLEQLGETAANLGALVAKAQDALQSEIDIAVREHEGFKAALQNVLTCGTEHKQALDVAARTHDELWASLNSFLPQADRYFEARVSRNSDLIGLDTAVVNHGA
jgi:hypothetical protein